MDIRNLEETVISGEKVFEGKLISVEHWQVRTPGGRTALREIVRHVGAAAVVPLDADGSVTLVQQHRVAMDGSCHEIPAGKKDGPDEDALVCAKRELAEETGLRAREWRFLTTLDTSPGFLTERIGLYLAEGLSQGETNPDEDEYVRLVRMPLEEAVARVMRGEIADSKTVCGLLMAWTIYARRP